MMYSIIGILAALILLMINKDVLFLKKGEEASVTLGAYRLFLLGVLVFYLADALWGFLDVTRMTRLQFWDTALYFASMAAAVLLWTRYVITYLEEQSLFTSLLLWGGRIFLALELLAVVLNFFHPLLYWFDGAGAYHPGWARYVTLGLQILLFLLTSVYTLQVTRRTEGKVRLRHRTIGLFGIAMVALIAVQMAYPLLPMYAVGYMLGTCLLHSFVVEDEKEEYRRELEEGLERERLQREALAQSREALREALSEAEQASRAKTVFLNNVSHDIRTPMNAIVGFTALAASHLDNRELVEDYLEKITVSSQHLLSLINDVLDMSRIESGRMVLEEEPVHLPSLLQDLKNITQGDMAAKGLSFALDTRGLVHGEIIVDKLRLNQVLLNILSNAVKFTPEGGSIGFEVRERPGLTPGTVTYSFRIKDTGVGMSEEFQRSIFEAFTRERTSTVSGIQGTGLGMAITKRIVDMMGGTIRVKSAPGEGSEFLVEIPCRPAKEEESPQEPSGEAAPAPGGRADFSGKRVLLAEDNEMNQMIAEAILTELGFAVDIAGNGERAVALLSQAPAGTYDIVLMDIQMPVMDGYEAARQIRALAEKEKARVPIVAVTANVFEEDRRLALEAGMDGHLAKPYDIPAMTQTLEVLLAGKPERKERGSGE